MWFRKRAENDFQAEIESHVRLEADRLIAEGMPPSEAEAAARRAFGNVTIAREQFRESQRWVWLDQLAQDLRYGLRSLRKAPAFTAAAALTIAIGVGANTAVFSLMDAVLLRSLPVRNPQELLFLETAGTAGKSGPPPYPCFSRMRAETRSFTGLAAFATDEMRVEIDGRAEQVMGQAASGNYFELLGVNPILGRVLTAEDERLDPPAAVISERYWRLRFNADPSVIGKSISSPNRTFVIVGVTPAEFFGLQPGSSVDVTVPITVESRMTSDPSAIWLHGIVGRLQPGVSSARAQAESDAVYRSFMSASRFPSDLVAKHFHHLEVEPAALGLDSLRRRFSRPLFALMGIVGLLLLLATANIANLLLARGVGRAREFAVRLAAGAGRQRIGRQLLTETLLLFSIGAIPGILCAYGSTALIEAVFREGRRAITLDAGLNWRVLAFSTLVTLTAGLLAGLFPAWRAFRTDPDQSIKEGQTRSSESRGAGILTQSLVAFQVALSLVLLIGALLFVRTLSSLRNVDTGFRGESVLTMSIQLPPGQDPATRSVALWSHVLEEVRRLPGVRSAAVSNFTPLSGRDRGGLVRVRGYEPQSTEDASIHINHVSEGYFETLGVTLLRGRCLTERDSDGAPRVALVNESAARKYFGDRDPIGESLEFTRKNEAVAYSIVGVVRDTKHMNLRQAPQNFAYIPIRQPRDSEHRVTLLLASASFGGESALLQPVRNSLQRINPGILVSDVITIQSQLDSTLVTERLLSGLSSVFGFLAMTLAAVGLYGVLSYRIGRQRQSIGIRMALGASPSAVAWGVLRQSGLVVAAGLILGLPVAIASARIAGDMLWGVTGSDPSSYLACIAALALVAFLSALLPARRASSIEPAEALRHS